MLYKKFVLVVLVVAICLVALPKAAQAAAPPPNIYVKGFRFQVRKDVPHSFGSCVARPVNHFHVEVFQETGVNTGRFKYLTNLHIGTYRQARRCYVVWNNYSPRVCADTCNGGSKGKGLTSIIYAALVAVVTVIGVTVAVGLIWIAAVALSGALAPALY